MRKEKILIDLLRGLVELIAEESERNPEFAERLGCVLSALPEKKTVPKNRAPKPAPESLPDIYAEWENRGETELRLWLCEHPIPVLRAIIRTQDMDATRRTTKWKEAEKLAEFIADSLRDRLLRGSAFVGRAKEVNQENKVCPECGHQFKGNGFDGMDAHWRAKHEDIMPYEDAWPLIKSGTYVTRQLERNPTE